TNPGILIDKSPDLQTLPSDGTVTFTITVTNVTDVDIRQTHVVDPLTADCDRSAAEVRALANTKGPNVGWLLKPDESFTYTCVAGPVAAPWSNTASVTGVAEGVSIRDSNTADVVDTDPGIDIEKTPTDQQATAGSSVTFTITVTNTGAADLRQTTIGDEVTPDCARTAEQVRLLANDGGQNVGFLFKPGESFTYTCVAAAVAPPFSNVASAQGIAEGVSIQDTDTATVTEPPPP
ncbi:MAG: hypothetical protein R3246_10910, partial [Acidimicrobiia bacterium]|nr:hypothetical protein [Acidimicrobiia bacterium]